MKLFDIHQSILKVLDGGVDPETGEINEEAAGLLSDLEMAKEEKVLNIAKVIKTLVAEQKAFEAEKKRVDSGIKSRKNRVQWLKGYLMDFAPGLKVKDAQASVSYRSSESVLVTCEPGDLPEIYQKHKVDANKTALKLALKSGESIEGAEIVTKEGVQIK